MSSYDKILVPCPRCGKDYEAHSKGGECTFETYRLSDAPANVLGDVNRHAPFRCDNCSAMFEVKLFGVPVFVGHDPAT